MASREAYRNALRRILEEAREGNPVWSDPAVLSAGIPQYPGRDRFFRGINILLLWHAYRSMGRRGPSGWTPRRPRVPEEEVTVILRASIQGRKCGLLFGVWPDSPRFPAPLADREVLYLLLARVREKYRDMGLPEPEDQGAFLCSLVAREVDQSPLVLSIATAMLLARLRLPISLPPTPVPDDLDLHNLPLRVSQAHEVMERVWRAHLADHRENLFPRSERHCATPDRAGPAPAAAARIQAALQAAPSLPEEAYKAISAIVHAEIAAHGDRLFSEIEAEFSDRPQEISGQAVVDWLLQDRRCYVAYRRAHLGDPSLPEEEVWRDVARKCRECLIDGKPIRPMLVGIPEADRVEAEAAWSRMRRRYLRTTWIHRSDRLSHEDLLDTRLPWQNEIEVLEPRGDLQSLVPFLGLPRRSPIQENDLRNRLVPGLSAKSWSDLLHHLRLEGDAEPAYTRRGLSQNGKVRWLDIPWKTLRQAQAVLSRELCRYVHGSSWATAFFPYRSVAWHARIHAGARSAVIMDVADFFGSIRPDQVRPVLTGRPYTLAERRMPGQPLEGWSSEGIDSLLRLMFHPRPGDQTPFLPQGAPSSPLAANLAAAGMDRMVRWLANRAFGEVRWKYSRYADDLVLSTQENLEGFEEKAERILGASIRRQGWRPSPHKTRQWRSGRVALHLCGIRIPSDPAAPLELDRTTARRVRVAMHRLSQGTRTPADLGLVAWGYSVTGEPRMLGHLSALLQEFSRSVAGTSSNLFLEGWLSS